MRTEHWHIGRTWKLLVLNTMISILANATQPIFNKYSVLKISSEAVTTDGRIDFRRWEKWDFPFCEQISVGRYRYTPIRELFFLASSPEEHPNARSEEQTRRYEHEINARKELTIIQGRIFYQGRRLNYPKRIHGGNRPWGATVWDGPPQGFRFGDYLIFMVQVRVYFRINPYDFVVYNLSDDSFAIHETSGSWPVIEVYLRSESVPNPHGKPL